MFPYLVGGAVVAYLFTHLVQSMPCNIGILDGGGSHWTCSVWFWNVVGTLFYSPIWVPLSLLVWAKYTYE